MWIRKKIKSDARLNLKNNYFRLLGVSLLIAFVFGSLRVESNLSQVTDAANYLAADKFASMTNSQIMNEWTESIKKASSDRNETLLLYLEDKYTPTKGALAKLYNNVTQEKSFLYGMLNATNSIVFKDRIGAGLLILTGAILSFLFVIFIVNVLLVGQCRFVLESRIYYDTKIGRILFPWRVKRWRRTSVTMMKRSIYTLLWDITIIGGLIKRYSYKMIPYILAENPDITSKEAFEMSRDMMNGNKFKAFVMDISLIGWYILSFLTLGAVKWLYVNPYLDTIYAELYIELRKEAIEANKKYVEYFNDPMLCAETSLREYPVEQHPLYNEKTKRWIKVDYHRHYSFSSAILLFFSFSIIGWLWEMSLHLFNHGEFVNRGTMYGPWLPIYGTGGVLIVLLLKRFADKPFLLFASAVILCGTVEYVTAWFLWERFHMEWWDYSGYFLNLHGRICAEGLLVFGVGGCGFVYIIAPLFDEAYKRIPKKLKTAICIVLVTLFAIDGIYSMTNPNQGAGVTDYAGSEKILQIAGETEYIENR